MVEEIPYDEIIEETCPSCRHTVARGTEVCPNCGYRIRGEEPPEPPRRREVDEVKAEVTRERAGLGGVLIIASGFLAVLTGLSMMLNPDPFINWYSQIIYTFTADAIMIWGAIMLIFGLVAIVGGVMASKRRSWALALTGGFLGFIASGGLFLGTVLGLIGMILVLISKSEFRG